MDHAEMRPEGGEPLPGESLPGGSWTPHAARRGAGGARPDDDPPQWPDSPQWTGFELRTPVVVRDDAVPEPQDGYAPSFVPGSEQPVPLPGEYAFAAVPGCGVVLSCRVPGTLSWLDAWRSPTRCTATVTTERVVFGCRLHHRNSGHPHAGKVIGGALRYASVSRVGIWLAPGDGDSHLLVYGRDEQRQWRLAIGSPDLTHEGADLAEELVVAVARRHLAADPDDPAVRARLAACLAGVRLRPSPGHGATVTLPGELPMPG